MFLNHASKIVDHRERYIQAAKAVQRAHQIQVGCSDMDEKLQSLKKDVKMKIVNLEKE